MESKSGTVRYILPKSVVIHVEKGRSVPDNYEFELVDVKYDGTEEAIHRVVPVIKYWELTEKELIERQLYPLLPLRIFLLRDELKKYANEKDSEDKRQLVLRIKELAERTITEAKKLAETGKINAGDDDRIVTALGRLIRYLNDQYNFGENIQREVDGVIKSVFTELREEGEQKRAVETAEKMILRAKPLSEIIEFSGLTEKKIRQLAKKLSKEIVL